MLNPLRRLAFRSTAALLADLLPRIPTPWLYADATEGQKIMAFQRIVKRRAKLMRLTVRPIL